MKNYLPRVFAALTLFAAATLVRAEVKMSPLFGDHMVLQQDVKLPVYGTADPGEKVTVSISGRKGSAVADPAGQWIVRLDPLPVAREGVELTVAGTNTLTFKDVLIGDVWVCSGQSNMEFGVGIVPNSAATIAGADQPEIRLFLVDRHIAFKPETAPSGKWVVCTPETIKKGGWEGFSAAGYFFGKEIQEDRKIPVGLIGTYWGGTPAQSWTSLEALKANPALEPYANGFEDVDRNLATLKEKYEKELPAYVAAHDAWAAEFGAAQAAAMAQWTQDAQKAAAAGQPFPPQPKPEKPEPIKPAFAGTDAGVPTVLYNGMIAPVIPYGIKGAIWYQGESNAGAASEYAILFPAMISDWRRRWGLGDFPFLFVQLAGFGPGTTWPELREAQRQTLSLPNTGMAVALDIGDLNDIHPRNKADVGHRLALAGRRIAYGEKVVDSGPTFDRMAVEGGAVRVSYKSVGGGLTIGANPTGNSDSPAPAPASHLEGFEIAGADGKFVEAKAVIDGATVVVSAADVASPVAVRYGWAACPAVNLYNREGLPGVPFQAK